MHMDCPPTRWLDRERDNVRVNKIKGVAVAWEFYVNKSQHLAPCKSLVTPETNWSHQTSVPSSSVVKTCLSLIQKSQLMSLYFLWFLIVPLCHILRAGLHRCLLWEIGMWDLCGFACWFALCICCCFFEPLAGRCCFYADQRATFSRQVSVSRGKANRLCLGQVLLTGRDLELRNNIPTEERNGL